MGTNFKEVLESLLSPIEGSRPAGEDLSYDPLFEQIGDARRSDDPALAKGDWATPLKVADWGKVLQLCETALRTRGKNLQLVMWYAEALTRREGYVGAAAGLRLVLGLMERFWETFHPKDPDERMGKLEGLNSQLGQALRRVPLTKPEHGGYDLFQWEGSRDVENKRRGGEHALVEQLIKDGKLPGDVFDKSALDSGVDWYQKLIDDLAEARAAYDELTRVVDERFGDEAPGFSEIRETLKTCQDVVRRLFERCGGSPAGSDSNTSDDTPTSDDSPGDTPPPSGSTPRPSVAATGPISSRSHAVRQLREIARYFREHEPYSPVALLAERAAKWGEMPLESWLKTVIKDPGTLTQLRELLDIRPDDAK